MEKLSYENIFLGEYLANLYHKENLDNLSHLINNA
jgi:hypothetical protein